MKQNRKFELTDRVVLKATPSARGMIAQWEKDKNGPYRYDILFDDGSSSGLIDGKYIEFEK